MNKLRKNAATAATRRRGGGFSQKEEEEESYKVVEWLEEAIELSSKDLELLCLFQRGVCVCECGCWVCGWISRCCESLSEVCVCVSERERERVRERASERERECERAYI